MTGSSFLAACAKAPLDERVPVWFMRQAGRSLPEYKVAREGVGMLESCARPDLVTEITLQPVRRHGVDAAILFSDIVLPLVVAGLDIEIKPGIGPVVAQPVRSVADVDALPLLDPSHLDFLTTAVRSLVQELGPIPLIGFAGAPFTLATYLIEGGPSKEHARTKAFMYAEPAAWSRLMERLALSAATFLKVQMDAGASAVQLFDSWAGVLSAPDYEARVLPYSREVFEAIGSRDIPRIHFGVGTGELLPLIGDAGADVVGVDWRVPLDEAVRRIGGKLDRVDLAGRWYDTGPEAVLARVPEAVELIEALGLAAPEVPKVHFGVGTGELLPLIGDAGADVVGVDWRVPLDEAARRVGPGYSLQGNLDPAVLLADRATVDREVRRIVEQGRAARGHVFNLGHGVLPDTDPGVLTHVVELVHELSAR